MRQAFRIGVVLSALVLAVTGCGSIEWLQGSFGGKEAKGDPRSAERAIAKSDEAGSGPAQTASQPAPAAANGAVRQVGAMDVLFGFDRWDLNKAAQTHLLSIVKKLRENPKITADLQGYTDSVGPRDYNLWLGQKRVEMVRRYLVEKGVEQARIRSVGLGQVLNGGTPEEQGKNRRVTVKLMQAE